MNQQMMKKKEYIQSLVERAIDRKLTEKLKGVVKLNTKDISLEEFNEMMSK